MASSSGTSSESIQIQNSGSEEEHLHLINQRKEKRMLSNRESARRSRQRKQKRLDELTAQLNQMKKGNGEIITAINSTMRSYFATENENSVLRTQVLELNNRLESLNEILFFVSGNENEFVNGSGNCEELLKPNWCMVQNEAMAMFQYC